MRSGVTTDPGVATARGGGRNSAFLDELDRLAALRNAPIYGTKTGTELGHGQQPRSARDVPAPTTPGPTSGEASRSVALSAGSATASGSAAEQQEGVGEAAAEAAAAAEEEEESARDACQSEP